MSEDNNECEFANSHPLFEDVIYDENEMINLPTLFEDHLNDLPRLCIVTEGMCGPTSYNDLGSEQLLWIHTHSTQERIIVREASDAKKVQLRYLSIPLDFRGKFCIVHNRDKKGPETTLRHIIKESQLPVQIMFVRSEGPCLSSAYKLVKDANMIAIKEHQKHFFLANCMIQEIPSLVPTVIMMEPDISICYLKGRKSMTEEVFGRYVAEMRNFLETGSKYDRTCGYPEIVDVYPEELGVDDRRQGIPKSSDEGVLVSIDEAFLSNTNIKPPTLPPRISSANSIEKQAVAEQSKDNDNKSVPENKMKKKILSIPFSKKKEVEKKPNKKMTNNSPPHYEELALTDQDYHMYELLREVQSLPKTHMLPQTSRLIKQKKQCIDEIVTRGVSYESTEIDRATVYQQQPDCPKLDDGFKLHSCKIKHLTIKEVSRYLSLLGLEQFIESFQKEQIDGSILSELNEYVLISDFNFSFTQAIRLMKFVREGHVPK